ncbi:MAG: class C sortase, partial [Blautia sp.]
MGRKVFNFAVALLFLAGAGVLLYPLVSDWWNQRQQDQVIRDYEKTVGGRSKEELDKMRQKAQEYNENLLRDEIIIDPFDQVKERKVDGDYENTLNPDGNGAMGVVEIPVIDVNLPIYHGTSEEVLQKAIGHLEQTSFPIGGEGTHAVISGHRGLPSAELFTDLDQVEEGDVFYLHVLKETRAYQVDQIRV